MAMPVTNPLSSTAMSDDRPALQAIGRIRATQIRYRDELAARLEDLLRAYQDDYDGDTLSAGAMDTLVAFLNVNLHLRRPRISATPSGDLYAEWTGPDDSLLGVRFMEAGQVQYVIFARNTLHNDRVDRTSGTTTADALMAKLVHLADLQWLSE
jgi:hypothetical protein